MREPIFKGLKITYSELVKLLEAKDHHLVFSHLIPDIDHWIDMLYNPVPKNIAYKMATHFNNIDFDKFKTHVEATDAWQEIALIYYRCICAFKVFPHQTSSAPPLHLKRQITKYVSNYIDTQCGKRQYYTPSTSKQYMVIDEDQISNKLELEKMDPYIRYVYAIALTEYTFNNLINLTKTEVTYRYLRSILDEN